MRSASWGLRGEYESLSGAADGESLAQHIEGLAVC